MDFCIVNGIILDNVAWRGHYNRAVRLFSLSLYKLNICHIMNNLINVDGDDHGCWIMNQKAEMFI